LTAFRSPSCRPFRRTAALFALVAGAVALMAGCSRESQEGGGGFSMPPLPVETELVKAEPVVDRFTAVGSLEASESIVVVAEIDAIVVALPFREGQAIAAGGMIAQLDDDELAAQVARAEAIRDQRRATYERIANIVEQRAGAPQDLDDAAAALKVADAELELARARLAKTRISAPFPGIAGRRLVSRGAFLRSGTPITDLARIDELRVNFTAPERLLGRLRRGATVTITTTAFPDDELSGTIDVIDPVVDPATRSARVVARVANRDGLLRPGMSADVSVVLSERPDALTVSNEAVFVQRGQTLVYVVQPDSSVAPRPVSLGLRQVDRVEIVAGLEAGDRVVHAGHQKLFPGAKVVPIDAAAGAQPRGAAATAAAAAPAGGAAPADSAAEVSADGDRAGPDGGPLRAGSASEDGS
jgi:membrane fusion protein (multidrug efflux system)